MDTTEAEFSLCLTQWVFLDPDPREIRVDREPHLSLYVTHKTELAGAPAVGDVDLLLTLCARVTLAELPVLIEAQQRLLRLAGVVSGDE